MDIYRDSEEQIEQIRQKELVKDVGCQWDFNDLSWHSTAKDTLQSSANNIGSSSKKLMNISLDQIPENMNSRSPSNKTKLKSGSSPKKSRASIQSLKKSKSKDNNSLTKDGIIQIEMEHSKQNCKPSIFKDAGKDRKGQSKQQGKKKKETNRQLNKGEKQHQYLTKKHGSR